MKKTLLILAIFVIVISVFGYTGYESRVPNGSVNGCNTCHLNDDFEQDFKAAGNVWTPALALLDSDGDSFPNGVELLDPAGTWVMGDADPGSPALVTNPDDETDFPTGIDTSSFGEIKALFK